MRKFVVYLTAFVLLTTSATIRAAEEKPNFIIVFVDDQGYQDLGCFGSPDIRTPRLDQMAKEGTRFTDFYAQTVCGPSRAALMTGCYPLRVAIDKNRVEVHPHLHLNEITIAEVLKEVGYTSAAFGKWDLAGHSQTRYSPELLPRKQGFDYFFGTPTSNDGVINVIRNEEMIEKNTDMSEVTRRYTDEAIAFIRRSKEKPFFVYLAHSMPHVRLDASRQFKGKSPRGLYGDVIEEIDWNVGRILDVLKEEDLDQNTYVIYTSDNGPWYLGRSPHHIRRIGKDAEAHGGSAEPLRGAKTSTWEGGLRVPCIVRAPGRVPAGIVCKELASTLDMLPTLAALAGARAPADRVIDGHDIRDLIHGVKGAKSPTKAYFYYQRTQLQAVRAGKWKLHIPRSADKKWGHYSKASDAIAIKAPILVNLEEDIAETTDLAGKHPEVVADLMKYVAYARTNIGDVDRIGKNARFFDPQPKRPDVKPVSLPSKSDPNGS
jgi:arylsulfatase A-like enzyme